jgi:glycosyltransferase involved in cell wall biosynthesis
MEKLITVIIPVYNAEQYLDRCLSSILNNNYKNLEIILVDDGSKDNSGMICDRYAEKDSRFVVIHKSNGGTAAARNDALDIAQGEYIAFLDNDDYISPHFYKYMLQAIEDSGADIVVSEITREDNPAILTNQVYSKPVTVDKNKFILGTYTGDWTRNTTPWNKLYKRELFSNIRFPLGKGYEDAYTTYRLLFAANSICLLNNTLYCWYQNEESYSSQKDKAEKLLYREEAIRLQSEFYTTSDYSHVKQAATVFYMRQLNFMLWQLDHEYIQSQSTLEVRQQFYKSLKKLYRRNKQLLPYEDKCKIFETLYPMGAILHRKLGWME